MSKEHILLIEDEPDIQELIRVNLVRQGFRLSIYKSGEEGIPAIKAQQPKLILLDLMLPGIDGLEVCRILKNGTVTNQIPIIMVTAKGEDVDMVTGLELGADDYLTKPFSPRVLIAKIRALLRRRNSEQLSDEPSVTAHELEIHPGRFEVIADGRHFDLSLTEFRLLHFLAKNPGWVYSRYQIVSGVRGDDIVVTDRSVDVHVVGLRKKLGKYGDYIETVRGVGYRFRR
ncbi:MAG: response regulator [candidate division Zixibacteria bacterium]|nr:response regulator [candidate division Zixibacteria bacterium]